MKLDLRPGRLDNAGEDALRPRDRKRGRRPGAQRPTHGDQFAVTPRTGQWGTIRGEAKAVDGVREAASTAKYRSTARSRTSCSATMSGRRSPSAATCRSSSLVRAATFQEIRRMACPTRLRLVLLKLHAVFCALRGDPPHGRGSRGTAARDQDHTAAALDRSAGRSHGRRTFHEERGRSDHRRIDRDDAAARRPRCDGDPGPHDRVVRDVLGRPWCRPRWSSSAPLAPSSTWARSR